MHYDFIFAGGGMSALVLAYLIKSEKNLAGSTILIVDPNAGTPESKNICFWAEQLPALPLILKGKWDFLSFAGKKGVKTQGLDSLSYYCFDAASLLTQLENELKAAGGVTFLEDRVVGMDETKVQLRHSSVEYVARQYVFDSIPPMGVSVSLWQHFLGWEIDIIQDSELDAQALTLMDFRVDQSEGPAFMYLLPFSPRKALVEITVMSSDVLAVDRYEAYIENYLTTHFPKLDFTLRHTEQGKIPMQQFRHEAVSPGQIKLGIKGGMAKPTTGYTFLNSYRYARQIVQKLVAGESLNALPAPQKRFEFYDRLLLSIIRRNPGAVKPIMESLFYRNRYSTLLAFLSESTTLLQEAGILWSLPWKPFLHALYYEYYSSAPRDEAQSGADRSVLHPARLESEWLVE
jgi:lycopene beta-cyclase